MNTSLYISSGALQAYQQKIDNGANNIANVDTPGYKRRDHSFSEILASQLNNQTKSSAEVGRMTPNGLRVGYGVRTGLTQLDLEQGQAMETGNPFDLMIEGKGFFQVGYAATDGRSVEKVSYTRDGSFHLSPDPNKSGNYHLVNANGGMLLDTTGKPIELNGNDQVQFMSNGEIQFKDKNGQSATFLSSQQIGIVDIQNPHLLHADGNNEFSFDTKVLANGTTPADYVTLLGDARVSAGFLEGSNVDLTTEMTDLMTTQRSFQMNARAVSYADQMIGIANGILK